MAEERWAKIEGFPNYSVSDHGQVRNDTRGKTLRHGVTNHGYFYVNLHKNAKIKSHLVHRLVCLHFCENPNEERQVDHIDNNKENNHFTNLRWISHGNNQRNRRKKAGCSSQFQGVSWEKKRKEWRARIQINNKHKHLGSFDTEEAASHAFRAAVAFYHLEEFYPIDQVKKS